MTDRLNLQNTSNPAPTAFAHRGTEVLGEQGAEGRKAFFIQVEARPGQEDAVVQMLRDIRACVDDEPATGPWFTVRFPMTSFAIFEAFPDLAGVKPMSRAVAAAGYATDPDCAAKIVSIIEQH